MSGTDIFREGEVKAEKSGLSSEYS